MTGVVVVVTVLFLLHVYVRAGDVTTKAQRAKAGKQKVLLLI